MKSTENTVSIASGRSLSLSEGVKRYSNRVKNTTIKFNEFIKRLEQPTRTNETFAEYCKAPKKIKDDIKDRGYYVFGHFEKGIRKKSNLQERDAIVLDGDFLPSDYEFVLDLALVSTAHVYYSTHSHSPSKPRIRVVIPLTRSVTPYEYVAIARKIAEEIGIDYFDDTTYEVSRAMFWPSVSQDGEYVFYENKGKWLDPDDVLAKYTNWEDEQEWPLSSRELEKPTKALRRAQDKAQDPLQKTGIVGAFCRTYSIEDTIQKFLPDVYESGTGAERFSYAKGTTVNGAVSYDNKFLFSHHGTDPIGGRLVNAFDLVRIHKYSYLDTTAKEGTPVHRMPSYKAMSDVAQNDPEVTQELMLGAIGDFGEGSVKKDWLKILEHDDKGNISIKLTNIATIINHDENLAERIAFNELVQFPVYLKSLPWSECLNATDGEMWQNADDLMLRQYLETKYKVEVSNARVNDAVNLVALENRFHPVKDYLNSLEWDGALRVETMLHRYLGVKRSAYTDAVSRKVLCAAVARVFEPGCKFDYVMILEGKQGKRKSTFIEVLAGSWFGDNVNSFKGKEAVEGMLGQWIIELGELQAFGKAEIENIKSFISRREDRVRLAYDRRPGVFPRQTIFIGTTNSDDYLKDETGNRRFWPIHCEKESIDIESLKAERDQLWAEAMELWKSGEPLYLENEKAEGQATQEQKNRYVDDGWKSVIEDWLNQPIPKNYWSTGADVEAELLDDQGMIERERTCIREIWEHCFKEDISRLTPRDENRIRRCMKQIDGWSDKTKAIKFGKKYGLTKGYWKL